MKRNNTAHGQWHHAELGLVPDGVYDLQVFHAERNYWGSNYRFETTQFCLLPVDPPK